MPRAISTTNLAALPITSQESDTVETRIKEPVFIRTLRLRFDLLNPLNKNPPEAETRRGSYIAGIMC